MPIELDDICKMVGLILGRKKVVASDRMVEDLGAESADVLNIVVTAEERYGITIDESDVPSIRTVGQLHDFVSRRVAMTGNGRA